MHVTKNKKRIIILLTSISVFLLFLLGNLFSSLQDTTLKKCIFTCGYSFSEYLIHYLRLILFIPELLLYWISDNINENVSLFILFCFWALVSLLISIYLFRFLKNIKLIKTITVFILSISILIFLNFNLIQELNNKKLCSNQNEVGFITLNIETTSPDIYPLSKYSAFNIENSSLNEVAVNIYEEFHCMLHSWKDNNSNESILIELYDEKGNLLKSETEGFIFNVERPEDKGSSKYKALLYWNWFKPEVYNFEIIWKTKDVK